MARITEQEEIELLMLLEEEERSRVPDKLEPFRSPCRIKIADGGRGAGAKSNSFASLIVQRAHRERIRVLCTREIQLTLSESVHLVIRNVVARLGYQGWRFTDERITSPAGSEFIFRGMKDLRAAANLKSLEDIDICWIEEGQRASHESLSVLVPTIRKPGSEIWVSMNRETEADPVIERFKDREDCMYVFLEPGPVDNPWWTDELQTEMEEEYKRDPDEAEHVWGGQPRKQGHRSVFSRAAIKGAMDRDLKAEGAIEIGVDVARYGDDKTQMYKRKGLKVIDSKELSKCDTVEVAMTVWDFAGRDPSVFIKIDEGYNPGVVDLVRSYGGKVVAVSFGASADDGDKYPDTASEMWFSFPVDEADIPADNELMRELSGRQFAYDSKARRRIEAKDDFKKRNAGRSPDKADALLLCYYSKKNAEMPDDFRAAMRRRRGLV